jgi:hypothetical protein
MTNITLLYSIFQKRQGTFGKPVTVDEFVEAVQTGIVQRIVEHIRETPDREAREQIKKTLPAVMFQRDTDGGINPLMVIDWETGQDMAPWQDSIYMKFLSPSGNGYAVVMRLPDEVCQNWEAYTAYAKRVERMLNVTSSQGQASRDRVRFLSYDPHIYYNPEAQPLIVPEETFTLPPVDQNTGLSLYASLRKAGHDRNTAERILLAHDRSNSVSLHDKEGVSKRIDHWEEAYSGQWSVTVTEVVPPPKRTPFPIHVLPDFLREATMAQINALLARQSFELSRAGVQVETRGGFFKPQWANVFLSVYGDSSEGKTFNTTINTDLIDKYTSELEAFHQELSHIKKRHLREEFIRKRPHCMVHDNSTIETVMGALQHVPVLYTPGELPVLFQSIAYTKSSQRSILDATLSKLWDSDPFLVNRMNRQEIVRDPRVCINTSGVITQLRGIFPDRKNGVFYRFMLMPASIMENKGITMAEMEALRETLRVYHGYTPPSRKDDPKAKIWPKYDQYVQRLGFLFYNMIRSVTGADNADNADHIAKTLCDWYVENWDFLEDDFSNITLLNKEGLLATASESNGAMTARQIGQIIREMYFKDTPVRHRMEVMRKREKLINDGILFFSHGKYYWS